MIFNKKIIIGISGGVDSTIAAWLLLQKGYNVEGLFIYNGNYNNKKQKYIINNQDLIDSKNVCKQLGIFLHIKNFSFHYWKYVFQNFITEYEKGNTPNPDILCNKYIKFNIFIKYSLIKLNANFIATGHYIRNKYISGKYKILKALDYNKDQSYFLYILNNNLKKCFFPIGNFTKNIIRKIANKLKLINSYKKDSTGICLIENLKFKYLLNEFITKIPSVIINTNKKKINKHLGLIYYTIGQKINYLKKYSFFLLKKNIYNNILTVTKNKWHLKFFYISILVEDINWINPIKQNKYICFVKIRYKQLNIPCYNINIYKNVYKIIFNFPIKSVNIGQSVVLYKNNICLGGGIIKSCINLIYNI